MHWLDYLGVVAYLLVLVYIAYTSIAKVKSSDDFAVAGNKIVWPVLFATLAASFLGGGASLGRASKAFETGYAFMFAASAFPIAVILSGLFVAPRLKRYVDAYTVGDIMNQHYGHSARLFTGVLSLVYCAGILGAQALAVGTIFNVILGTNLTLGIVIGMGVVLLYSTLGGMWAVIQTDVVQFVMLAIFLPVTMLIGVHMVGGPAALVAALPEGHFTFTGTYTLGAFLSIFIAFLLGETLVPPYTQRALCAPDARNAKIGYTTAGVFGFLFYFVSTTIGLAAFILFPDIPPDQAMPTLIRTALPIGLTGLVLASMLAVVMSTADSYLNSCTVIFVKDIFQPLFKSDLSERQRLWTERVVNVIIGAGAIAFALYATSIVDALLLSYALWAPTVLIPFVAAVLFGLRTPRAAMSAMIAGAVVTGLWKWGPWPLETLTGVAALIPGVVANIVVFTLVATVVENGVAHRSPERA